jgi:hypothetical protein
VNRRPSFVSSLVVPLLNAGVDRELLVAENDRYRMAIVRVTDELRKCWTEHPRVNCVTESKPWMLPLATTAVRLDWRSPRTINELSQESEDLYALIGLLNVRLSYDLWTPFGAQKTWNRSEPDVEIVTFVETRPPSEIEFHTTISVSDYRVFRRYWRTIVGPSEQSQRLRRALARFRRARSSWYAEDAIIHAFIGLESLFAEHTKDAGRIANKVTRRLSRYVLDPDVSPSSAQLMQLSSGIAGLYQIRHDIVHGALPDESKTNDAAKDSAELLRTAILLTLEAGFKQLKDLRALANRFTDDLVKARREEKRRRRAAAARTHSSR